MANLPNERQRGCEAFDKQLPPGPDGQVWKNHALRSHIHDNVLPGEHEKQHASSTGEYHVTVM